jgi:beta-glucosidase
MEDWRSAVPAILMCWYGGMEGGTALARGLFGQVCPGGKLPFSIFRREEELPCFDPDAASIEYGPYHGYTLLEREGIEPAFAFGFGLSYTRFAVGPPRASGAADCLEVEAAVENVGGRSGDEVVQLYVGPERAGAERRVADRPHKLLRGFRRVHLEPGERRAVRFTVPLTELACWDARSNAWRVDGGRYTAWVGSSSREVDLQAASFLIRGGAASGTRGWGTEGVDSAAPADPPGSRPPTDPAHPEERA